MALIYKLQFHFESYWTVFLPYTFRLSWRDMDVPNFHDLLLKQVTEKKHTGDLLIKQKDLTTMMC